MSYKIIIDRILCIGAASCVAVAPKTFRLDNEAKAILLDVTRDEDNIILDAAKACPTNAITIIKEETGEQLWPVKS